jgi:alpha-beta hydrolase superfamily lysophospholipase
VILTPEKFHGSVLVIHGYGGCKEEILGLVMPIAEENLTVCVIDQRGHGESKFSLDDKVL